VQKRYSSFAGRVMAILRKRRFFRESGPRFASTIISTFPDIVNDFRKGKLKLFDCGGRDDLNSSDFDAKCDGQSDTIRFLQTTKDVICGGYAHSHGIPPTAVKPIQVIIVLFSQLLSDTIWTL
jgi:hypothetical protein